MNKPKYSIKIEGSDLKLIRNPKRALKISASKIVANDTYASLFPKETAQDILYISLVSYTIGHINRNDCIILPEEGLAHYKTSVEKPLNVEHERTDIVGFCVSSFLSNLKNDKILDEQEAQDILDSNGMVNVGNIFAVWKINYPELIDLLNENFDENSENFNTVKASFEYYFNDFDFYVSDGSSDYPNGKIISSDNPDAEKMYEALRINGGTGRWDGNRISVAPKDGFIGGVALTFQPANEFSDLTAKKDDGEVVTASTAEIDNKIPVESVINNIGENMSDKATVTPEVKEVKTEKVEASVQPLTVDADVANKLQSELTNKISELGAKDGKIKELEATILSLKDTIEKATAETTKVTELAQKVQAQLDKEIEARQARDAKEAEKAKIALIASRMAKIGEFVAIDDSNKALLEKECADASEEDFAKRLEFYKSISKRVVANTTETPKTEPTPEVKSTVEQVVADTAKDTKSVNIIAATPTDTLVEQYRKAFDLKGFGYTDKRLS